MLRRFCTAMLLVLVSVRAAGAQRAAPPAGFPRELDAYIAHVREAGAIPGLAIAIVRNDSVIVAKGYGVRELGKPGLVDENTVFDAASLAKSFTATAIATLVDEGRLRWDDPIRRWLPHFQLADPWMTEHVTLRDFLSHRTGLHGSNMMWVVTAVDRDEVVRRARFLQPSAPFRTTMVYSNVGYTIAGEAAAAAAGMTFEELLRDRVIKPLRLTSTTWSYAQAERMPNIASPHAVLRGVQRPIRREVQRHSIAPAGAVQSTVTDLARWMRLHLADGVIDGVRLVSDSLMQEMHSPQVVIPTTRAMRQGRMVDFFAAYGLGWQVMDYRGHPMLWHSGNGDGQIAYMALLPREKLGVVVLVNTWAVSFVHGAIAARVLDEYLGYERQDNAADALARVPATRAREAAAHRAFDSVAIVVPAGAPALATFAGEYGDSLFGPVIVRESRGRLTMQMGTGQIADLERQNSDVFRVRWRDPLFAEVFYTHASFERDSSGRITTLRMPLNRDRIVAGRR